jgi:type IX secretion system PorP/SprF family membrane protein
MANKVLFSTLVLFCLMLSNVKGQDPAFSQFYANPLYLNPAITGNTECARINLNYRNQWPSISNAYLTYSASYEQSLNVINSGIGLMVMNDVQGNGMYSRSTVGAFYAYNLQLADEWVLGFGVKGAYYQEKLSAEKFEFADQLDMTTGEFLGNSTDIPEKTNLTTLDFGSGLLLGYGNMGYFGISADHLTEPNLSFYSNGTAKLPMKLTAHSGVTINLTYGGLGSDNPEDLVIQPNILYQQQDAYKQLNAGFYISKFPFIFGGWFRNNFTNADAVMILAGITYNKMKFGYSYDYTVSKIGGSSGGAHEISASWDFCITKEAKRRKIRTIKSPMF